MSPQRIQRKRTKGWRMPEGAIYVGRPTRWGNPWSFGNSREAHAKAVEMFELHIGPMGRYEVDAGELDEWRHDLGGHDLACWCPLDHPCHADVLLELVNTA